MLVQLDYTDGRPIYEQIKDGIKKLILMNVLMPDEKLQSVRSLAMDLSTNPNTVQRAYSDLEREGYIYTDRRNGAHVRKEFSEAKELSEKSKELLQQIISEAKICGMTQEEFLKICENMYKG